MPTLDPILAAADLAVVACSLRDLRRALGAQAHAIDAHALDAAIAAVVALAVDCDAATSARPYMTHARAAAQAARFCAQARDAAIDDAPDHQAPAWIDDQVGRKGAAR